MYCHCGCGEVTAVAKRDIPKRNLKAGEHTKFRQGHHLRDLGPNFIMVESGCWLWQKYVNPFGYGVLSVPRSVRGGDLKDTMLAHRFYYWIEWGWLPEGDLDHTCEVNHCVNPDHLVPCGHLRNQIYMRIKRVLSDEGKKADPAVVREMVDEMIFKLLLIAETKDQDEDDDDDE